MAEASKDVHEHELQSDLDLLIEMTKEPKKDEEIIHRHLESLKAKLDKYIHRSGTHSGAGPDS